MIRITQSDNDHERRLLVEGTLSDGWVGSLEESWVQAKAESRRRPVRLDLSSVTYVDDKGRELLMRMMRDGVEIYTTGILTREVIGEITTDFDNNDARRTDGYIRSRITVQLVGSSAVNEKSEGGQK